MPFVVLLVLFIVVVLIVRAGQRGGRNALLARGIPARGLILTADRTATDTTYRGQRFEVRSLVLDVEVPGKPPYQVALSTMIPRICEALPGAALDLRVDRAKPNNLAIVGPAGSSQWLAAAATVPGQTWASQSTAARSGCGTLVAVLIGLLLSAASVATLVEEARETPAVTPAPSPAPTPTPHPTPTPAPTVAAPAAHHHPQCDAAVRCCETLGLPSCQALLSETEAACSNTLTQEKKAALKVGKHCQ